MDFKCRGWKIFGLFCVQTYQSLGLTRSRFFWILDLYSPNFLKFRPPLCLNYGSWSFYVLKNLFGDANALSLNYLETHLQQNFTGIYIKKQSLFAYRCFKDFWYILQKPFIMCALGYQLPLENTTSTYFFFCQALLLPPLKPANCPSPFPPF